MPKMDRHDLFVSRYALKLSEDPTEDIFYTLRYGFKWAQRAAESDFFYAWVSHTESDEKSLRDDESTLESLVYSKLPSWRPVQPKASYIVLRKKVYYAPLRVLVQCMPEAYTVNDVVDQQRIYYGDHINGDSEFACLGLTKVFHSVKIDQVLLKMKKPTKEIGK